MEYKRNYRDDEPYLVGECGARLKACRTMEADLGCWNDETQQQ